MENSNTPAAINALTQSSASRIPRGEKNRNNTGEDAEEIAFHAIANAIGRFLDNFICFSPNIEMCCLF